MKSLVGFCYLRFYILKLDSVKLHTFPKTFPGLALIAQLQ